LHRMDQCLFPCGNAMHLLSGFCLSCSQCVCALCVFCMSCVHSSLCSDGFGLESLEEVQRYMQSHSALSTPHTPAFNAFPSSFSAYASASASASDALHALGMAVPPPLTVQRELSAGIVIDTLAVTDSEKYSQQLLSPPASAASAASAALLLSRPHSAALSDGWRSPAPSVRSGLGATLEPPPPPAVTAATNGMIAPSPSPAALPLRAVLSARSIGPASIAGGGSSSSSHTLAQAALASLRHNCYRVGVFSSIRIGVHNRTAQPMHRLQLSVTPFQHTVGGGVDTNLHHKLLWIGSLDNVLPTVDMSSAIHSYFSTTLPSSAHLGLVSFLCF
jgi:hypothetical protein